jgi:hypothetical protein
VWFVTEISEMHIPEKYLVEKSEGNNPLGKRNHGWDKTLK